MDELATTVRIDLKALLDVIDDAAAVIDADGVVRAANRAYNSLSSEPAPAALPLPGEGNRLWLPAEPGAPAGPEGAWVAVVQAALRGEPGAITLALHDKAPAAERWKVTAIPCSVDGASGALLRLREDEGRIAEEHPAHLAAGIEAMQIGFHIYHMEDPADDRTLRLVYTNSAAARIIGRSAAEVVGERVDVLFPETRADGVLERYVHVIRTGEPFGLERTYESGDPDAPLGISLKGFALPGQKIGVLFEDITARMRLSRSLERTTAFLDSIIDNIPSVIFIKEARNLRYVRVNRAFEQLFDAPREQLLGKSDMDIFPNAADGEYAIRKDREVLAQGTIVDIAQETVVIAGKGKLTFHTRKVPLFDDQGHPLYLLGITDNITEQLSAEESRRNEIVLLETQKRLVEVIRELSTPVIPVYEGILVVPLVGQLDSTRSAQFLEALLSGIQRHSAEVVLIDITGVSIIDSSVADHLAQATRAAALLGTACHLVGVSPSVASTIVELGIDLGSLTTHRDLEAGLLDALARQGRTIVKRRR